MVGGEGNSYPIQLLVNYWEIRPSLMGARLDELRRRGVTHIATFVPWQAVESDISHSLTRFLLAATDRKMTLSLILTPEVGVHYGYSGLPKDVITRAENLAQHADKGQVPAHLPPNSFALPSLLAPEFTKRYTSFLSRMDTLLGDFERSHGRPLSGVTVVLSGSYWKYYRSPRRSTRDPFAGLAGDMSPSAALEFRSRVDYFYSQPEFSDPTPAAANRWKTRAMEEVNHRWFNQQSESVFRNRTFQMVRRKARSAPVREVEIFTPEADPGLLYGQFLQNVSGGHGDFSRLSAMVDRSATFGSMGSAGPAAPHIHWSALGAFRSLTDSEKQFLILKSLLLMGGLGGGVLIDEEEWFAMSANFRNRAEAFARSIAHGDLRMQSRVLYLTPHLWSGSGPMWDELVAKLGPELRAVASLDLMTRDREASVIVVDPNFVFTHEIVQKLASLARGGRVVVLPRTGLYSEMARSELELVLAGAGAARGSRKGGMEINHGLRYRVNPIGDGNLIVHEMPAGAAGAESHSAWQTFVSSILSMAEIKTYCRLSDSRLALVPMGSSGGRRESMGLFVLNGTRRQISADIVFPNQVVVSDLAVAVSAATPPPAPVAQPGNAVRPPSVSANSAAPVASSNRFGMDVPPCGILPLSVDGLPPDDSRERLTAALLSQSTLQAAEIAAASELPSYESAAFDSAFNKGPDAWS